MSAPCLARKAIYVIDQTSYWLGSRNPFLSLFSEKCTRNVFPVFNPRKSPSRFRGKEPPPPRLFISIYNVLGSSDINSSSPNPKCLIIFDYQMVPFSSELSRFNFLSLCVYLIPFIFRIPFSSFFVSSLSDERNWNNHLKTKKMFRKRRQVFVSNIATSFPLRMQK